MMLPIYTDDERLELAKQLTVLVEWLNENENKIGTLEYNSRQIEAETLYEIVYDL
tara:strand:+ start:651 stop:815 length:165 start_codon:yes stop_codon:yes gene_type:complete